MMRIALLATAIAAAVVAGLWAWSVHPNWPEPRTVLHPLEWSAIQRNAAGGGFPTDVESAKARILLAERGARPKDWKAQPGCWTLDRALRHWRVCAAPDGRTRSIALTWPKEPAYPRDHPDRATVREGINLLVWVTSPGSGLADRQALLVRAEERDLGPAAIVGVARIRGLYRPYSELYLQAMPAALPLPPDWTYRPPPPPEYFVD
ncbi:hypothetical protein QO010_001137 [Caulobacter ginsengisoli]|uniref:Uncharacterized protein n=1 Tax=Caulobacter ginsengisoli TaxID=400775 RepID=A0ABU0IPQ9_9CAUL|nr:hypothetical protein [Caulobacter ginsengisoli]MDQ0463366.1 hypothetical protein [Caulobacter ginsengisoli]